LGDQITKLKLKNTAFWHLGSRDYGSFVKYVKGYYQVAEKLNKSAMLQTCFPHGFRIYTCKDNIPMVNHSWCTRWMHLHWFQEVKKISDLC